jgi:hypothetical protein
MRATLDLTYLVRRRVISLTLMPCDESDLRTTVVVSASVERSVLALFWRVARREDWVSGLLQLRKRPPVIFGPAPANLSLKTDLEPCQAKDPRQRLGQQSQKEHP